jgi:hypothetical protein
MAKTTTGTEFEVSCPSGWGCSVIRCEHKSPSDGHQNWMMEHFNRKALYLLYLMVKTHGFPVKIFPNKPIH